MLILLMYLVALGMLASVLLWPYFFERKMKRATGQHLDPILIILLLQYGALCESYLSTILHKSDEEIAERLEYLRTKGLVKCLSDIDPSYPVIPGFTARTWSL